MNAETAYLFRHALLRDAAYQLQLPGDRAKLHALAAEVAIQIFSGPAGGDLLDRFASEIADHLRIAREHDSSVHLLEVERAMTARAAEFNQRHFRHDAAADLWQRLALISEKPARADCYRRAGMAAANVGTARAERLLMEGLAIARAQQNSEEEASLLANLAALLRTSGRLAEATDMARRSAAINTHLNLPRARASSFMTLAGLLGESGENVEAEALVRQVLSQCADGKDEPLFARACLGLGSICQHTGRVQEAASHFAAAQEAYRRLGDAAGECDALGNYAAAVMELGRRGDAEEKLREVIALAGRIGLPKTSANSLSNLAILLTEAGRTAEAGEAVEAALGLHREFGERRSEAVALLVLADIRIATAQIRDAKELAEQALKIHREIGNRRWEAVALNLLAECAHQSDTPSAALPLLRQAAEIARAIGDQRVEARFLCRLACLSAESSMTEARTHWEIGTKMLARLGLDADLKSETACMREFCAKAGVPLLDQPNQAVEKP